MTDQLTEQRKKLLLFFFVGTFVSLASALAFEARFAFHWMRDVSMVSWAVTSPGYFLYIFVLFDFRGLPRGPLWLVYTLASITNGFVYAGAAYLLSFLGIGSTKKQLIIIVSVLFALGASFLCMWEGCYRTNYWT